MITIPSPGSVVGTIPSIKALAQGIKISKKQVDFLEIRVDAFVESASFASLEKDLKKLRVPLILTVRHPLEGGNAEGLTFTQRKALFRQFLPYVSFVDVELRSVSALNEVLVEARAQGAGIILSYHNFRRTPSLAVLEGLRHKAARVGCDILKVAAETPSAKDLGVLLNWLATQKTKPALAVMGMGKFGKISRLVLGQAGSVLNYGYLEKPQVPGQWPAILLKERLREITEKDS